MCVEHINKYSSTCIHTYMCKCLFLNAHTHTHIQAFHMEMLKFKLRLGGIYDFVVILPFGSCCAVVVVGWLACQRNATIG